MHPAAPHPSGPQLPPPAQRRPRRAAAAPGFVVADASGTGCLGSDGYDDIAESTNVTVYDEAGVVVAAGALSDPEPDVTGVNCVFAIVVPNVPNNHAMYQVEVTDRGKVAVDADSAKVGEVALSLG